MGEKIKTNRIRNSYSKRHNLIGFCFAIPALIFLPYWLFFSGYPERNNNLKLLPLFFALWSGAALYVHFKYGASLKTMGLLILAGVAVYTLTIIKSFKHVKPKLIVGVLAVIVVVLMLFVHRGNGGNIVFHLP